MTEPQPTLLRSIAWIVIAGVALRMVWALLVPVIPISDSFAYDTFARMLAEHGVFGWGPDKPFAFWPPGTSFLHGALYKLFGIHHEAIVALNIVLTFGITLCCARLGLRYFGERVAYWTAILISFWPTLIFYSTVLASELPFLFFCVAALDVWTGDREKHGMLRALGAGALLGCAALVRPVALLLPAVYGGAVLLHRGITREAFLQQFRTGALALIAMLAVISPWTYRNYQLYGEPVLISTNGGITFWMGNTPGTDGGYMDIPTELHGLSDLEQERILGARARQYILDEPGTFVLNTLRKFVALYGNESIGVVWNERGIAQAFGAASVLPLKRFTQLAWLAIVLCTVLGCVALIKEHGWRHVVFSPIVVSIAYFTAVYIVTVAQDRYRLSFAGQIGIVAAAGVGLVRRRATARRLAMGT